MLCQGPAVCVPTYRRTSLLRRLVEDVSLQSTQPEAVIIVDGDPATGDVLRMLSKLSLPAAWKVVYVPSNHANLAYQRYLGWRVARDCGCDVLVYFDDDVRLPDPETITKLHAALSADLRTVGVTAPSNSVTQSGLEGTQPLADSATSALSALTTRVGLKTGTPPGGLTPVGHRRWPQPGAQAWATTHWLQGRVMAYRMSALDESCFSEDLFALTRVGCGLGEDTFLSRQVGRKGRLLMVFDTEVEHPGDDTPKAYPYRARPLAYATAYSRRFLNDHYRSPQRPTVSDRLALLRNYLGVTALAWLRAFASLRADRFAYAWGYTQGAIRGLLQKPTAKNLTPRIDWWADAEEALARRQVLVGREAPAGR